MSRIKFLFIALLLLMAGFAGGWAVHRYMVVNRMQEVAMMRQAGGFKDHLYRRIEATPEQRRALDPVIQKYGRLIDSMHAHFGSDRRRVIEQMHEEIRPSLSEKQIEKLGQFSRRFEMRDHHSRKRRRRD